MWVALVHVRGATDSLILAMGKVILVAKSCLWSPRGSEMLGFVIPCVCVSCGVSVQIRSYINHVNHSPDLDGLMATASSSLQ